MRWPPARGVLAATLVAIAVLGVGSALRAGASYAASPGLIVFASDRGKYNPGEIYSLAPGSAPLDVSHTPAREHGLAVAPVGDQMAFWSSRSGDDEVYLARSDGTRLRLVRGLGDSASSSQSREGGALTFSADGSSIVAVLYRGLTSDDFVIDVRRATARAIRRCGGVLQPSPDGKLLACSVRGSTSVLDIAGHLRFTLPDSGVTWSSRGWLTGSPAKPGAPAVIVDASGRTVGHVTGAPIAWSPDGGLLLFERGHALLLGDPRDLGRARTLVQSWARGAASFTPDGRYVSTGESTGRPILVPVAGGSPIRGFAFGSAVWSRDGRVAYIGRPSPFPERPGVTIPVFIAGSRGQHPQLAGRFPWDDHGEADLVWTPGGKRLLFLTVNTCSGSDLFGVSPTGGPAVQLTHDLRDLESPAWSRDGTTIAYAARNFTCHLGDGLPTHLETVHADGSEAQRVTDDGDMNGGSFDGDPAFSPDGTQIAFDHGTFSDSSLQVVAASGGARTTLVPPGPGAPSSLAWSPDGSRIAFVSAASRSWSFRRAAAQRSSSRRSPRASSAAREASHGLPTARR
jgi:Tol biopolymer transport system component